MTTDIISYKGMTFESDGGFRWRLMVVFIPHSETRLITSEKTFADHSSAEENLRVSIQHITDGYSKLLGLNDVETIDKKTKERQEDPRLH